MTPTLFLLIITVLNKFSIAAGCSSPDTLTTELRSCLLDAKLAQSQFIAQADPAYGSYNHQWQMAFGEKHPLGYILPKSQKQVGGAINCLANSGIQVTPKSGGHSYGSYSFGGENCTAILDLQLMTQLKVDQSKGTARLGPGHLLGPLHLKLYENGNYTAALGTYPTVGLGGLALGGGHGYQTKSVGLAVQNILELEMVDWRGQKLIANKKKNSDLFWALRGAGIGSYGIVTKIKLRLYKAPERILRSELVYTLPSFVKVFGELQNFELDSTARQNLHCALSSSPTANHFAVNCFEFDPEDSIAYAYKKYFDGEGAVTVKETVLSYLEFARVEGLQEILEYDPYFHASRSDDKPHLSYIKSVYVKRPLSNSDLSRIEDILKTKPDAVSFFVDPYGGKVNELAETDKFYSFAHTGPNILYLFGFHGGSEPQDIGGFNATVTWIKQAFNQLEAVLDDPSPQSYQNYADADLSDYLERYYLAENLPRLSEIKRKYDPHNRFSYPQSIPLEYTPKI